MNFSTLTSQYSKSTSGKIRRFLQYEECTFPDFGYKQKSNHRTPTNQVLESRGKDLKTLFNFFSQRKVQSYVENWCGGGRKWHVRVIFLIDTIRLVEIEEVKRAIRALPFVTKLSPVDAHKGKVTGWGVTLKCASCPGCCASS